MKHLPGIRSVDPNKPVIIYRSSYGLPLGGWDTFMNKLWYYTADQKKLWAKCLYYPIHFLENLYYRLTYKEVND